MNILEGRGTRRSGLRLAELVDLVRADSMPISLSWDVEGPGDVLVKIDLGLSKVDAVQTHVECKLCIAHALQCLVQLGLNLVGLTHAQYSFGHGECGQDFRVSYLLYRHIDRH